MKNLVFACFLLACSGAKAATVFSFVDDGGDHPYADKCDFGADVQKDYSEHKKNLKGADAKTGFLGSYQDSGEGGEMKVSFFSSQKSCDAALKKARAWYDKENKK